HIVFTFYISTASLSFFRLFRHSLASSALFPYTTLCRSPVVGELEIGQMVVPHGIVQAHRLVPRAPLVSGPLPPVDDEGGNTQLTQASSEGDSALSPTDDEDVRVGGPSPGRVLLGESFRPALPFGIDTVDRSLGPPRPLRLLVAGQFLQRGEHGPGFGPVFVDESHEPFP